MIPNKVKDILLLPVTNGWLSQGFNMPGFPGYDKAKSTHNGIDIGSVNGGRYVDILACQDGTVVEVLNNDSSRGNGVVLQHDYEDGTHRWTGYIHLKDTPTVKKGQTVRQGEKIGVRGGSPYVNGKAKYGVHLHLYVTSANKEAYRWSTTFKSHIINPLPLVYLSKKYDYELAGVLAEKPYMEDVIPEVVAPVERDELMNQLSDSTDKLRVRMSPSLSGNIIGHLQANAFYNFYETTTVDGYTWRQIADNQWCAQTGTMTIYPKRDETELLHDQVEKLTADLEQMTRKADKLQAMNEALTNRIAQIRNLTMDA